MVTMMMSSRVVMVVLVILLSILLDLLIAVESGGAISGSDAADWVVWILEIAGRVVGVG